MDFNDISYYDNPRLDLLHHIPHDVKQVLDVGCGTGSTGCEIKSKLGKDIKVVGIELNPSAGKVAENKIDNIIIGNVENVEIPYDNNYFDCIIYADVLEHLIDPWKLLIRHRSKLSDNGCIIASIPNIAHYKIIRMLKRGLWKYENAGIMDKTHLRFFTKKTILKMFLQADLTPIIIDKILSGNEYWRLKHKLLNNDCCVVQYIIKATKTKL